MSVLTEGSTVPGLFVSATASCLVIDVWWEENLAVSFPADSTRGDFRNGYGIFPPLIQIIVLTHFSFPHRALDVRTQNRCTATT